MNPNAIEPWKSSAELTQHISALALELNLAQPARAYIDATVRLGPSRQVQGRQGNVCVLFQSRKTGGAMMLESRRGEWAAACMFEHDKDVLAFLPQPPTIRLRPTTKEGRVESLRNYTPDFIVIRKDAVVVFEVRGIERLMSLAASSPHQFYVDDSERWHYRAAEDYFVAMGLRYELLATTQLPTTLINNARYLEGHQDQINEVDPDAVERLRAHVAEHRCVGYMDLIQAELFTADQILSGIVSGAVYVDLMTTSLARTHELQVASDEATYRACALIASAKKEPPLPLPGAMYLKSGTQVTFQGTRYTVMICGERDVVLQDPKGGSSTIPIAALKDVLREGECLVTPPGAHGSTLDYAQLSEAELERALMRLNAARGNPTIEEFSQRSISRFRSLIQGAGNDMEALGRLTDACRRRGNRTARLPQLAEELMGVAIESHYNTPEKRSKTSAYKEYVRLCENKVDEVGAPLKPASFPTFCQRCDEYESIELREGRRAKYQKAVIPQFFDNGYPVNGERPHDVVYMDHTTATIATVSSEGVALGKPTLTIAVDGNSKRARALVLNYDPPSARTVLMAMRDYVRRNGCMPRVLVVDNGKEFHSRELELFCRLYNIEIRYRAPGMPRGGSQVERLLGSVETEVLGNMQGNTRQMVNARQVTKSVDPFRRAVWTLAQVYAAIEEYLFETRPKRVHGELGQTPEAYEAHIAAVKGRPEHRVVLYNSDLLLMTCPHARQPYHKVDRRRGVWIGGSYYRHPAMDHHNGKTKVEVRVEPWDAGVIYVRLACGWVTAISSSRDDLRSRTNREYEIALRRQREVGVAQSSKDRMNAASVAFNSKLKSPLNFDPQLGRQQKEMVELYRRLGMGPAIPLADAQPQPGEEWPTAVTPAPDAHDPIEDKPAAANDPQYDGVADDDANYDDGADFFGSVVGLD